jgi:hypothetical protein
MKKAALQVAIGLVLGISLACGFFWRHVRTTEFQKPHDQIFLEEAASWQKLAVFPERWLGKNIQLEGWLYVQLGEGGAVGDIYLYETLEFLRAGIPSRSLNLSKEALYEAVGPQNPIPKVKLFRNKCISLSGKFEFPKNPYNLGDIDGPISLKASPYDVVAD